MPNSKEYRRFLFATVGLLANLPVYAFAVTGILAWRRRLATLALLFAPVLYYAGLHAVFVGSVCYRAPVMPFLIMLATVALLGVFAGRPKEKGEAANG